MTMRWKNNPLLAGIKSEQLALQWLRQQGLSLVIQNYRCKIGEIDIIMNSEDQLVFVEVRYRKQPGYGSAIESVDRYKQIKLVRAAAHFLTNNPVYANRPCRFDVIAAKPAKHSDKLHWQWIKNAFTA